MTALELNAQIWRECTRLLPGESVTDMLRRTGIDKEASVGLPDF